MTGYLTLALILALAVVAVWMVVSPLEPSYGVWSALAAGWTL